MITPEELKRMAEEPIKSSARALRLNLPMGKRPPPRAPKSAPTQQEQEWIKEARVASDARRSQNFSELLAYYAASDVPVERVAQNCGMTEDAARKELRRLGRDC